MENRIKLSNELFDIIDEMTAKQFNEYAIDFMGTEGLFNYIKNAISSAEEELLKKWIKEAKRFLK